MAYTVLARRYRSATFDDLVGQEAIARTLKNAITTGRIAHGYLFCGTRGVGKTSSARIFAKALNCHATDGPTPTPCLACDSCLRIAAGDDVDCIEIDAASNTGVDNVRELRSNAAFRPARSRFKIYIIDEVHMLSTAAFNALLKTLEEPPNHVKFILATTDPQKVPETVRSRVQRFDFKPIPADKIYAHFASLLQQESIQFEEPALRRIARLANGSMRDGLSLLDQLLSVAAGHLTAELVDTVLPNVSHYAVAELVDALADADPARALQRTDALLADGLAPEQICAALTDHFHAVMLLAACGPQTELVDAQADARQRLTLHASHFDSAACVYIITLLDELRRNLRFTAAPRALIDAAIVRLAEAAKFADLARLIAALPPEAPPPPATAQTPAQPPGRAYRNPPDASHTPADGSPSPTTAGHAAPLRPPQAAPTNRPPIPPLNPPPKSPPVPQQPPPNNPTRPAADPAPSTQNQSKTNQSSRQTLQHPQPQPPATQDPRQNPVIRHAICLFSAEVVHIETPRQPRKPPSSNAPDDPDPNP